MRKYLGEFSIELSLILLGAVASALEAILAQRTDIALLVVFLSLLLAISVLAIRQEIARQVGDALIEQRLINQIPDPRWQKEARSEIEQARVKYASWAGGTRRVPERSSLNFQIEALTSVKTSVRAVHLALERDSLTMWDNRQRGFDRLVDAYRSLPDHIQKRRILVLPDDPKMFTTNDGQRTITDDLAVRVCRLQAAPKSDAGLGFDLRISWVPLTSRDITDLLIVDDREVCSIESYGHGHFGDLEVCVNDTVIEYQTRRFEDLWTDAVPAEHCLPKATP